jgi:hypothetical protein
MCGPTGFWEQAAVEMERDLTVRVERMSDALVHRGPDDAERRSTRPPGRPWLSGAWRSSITPRQGINP